MFARRGSFFFFLIFLLFPYLLLLSQVSLVGNLDFPELWWAFKNSVFQASLSAIGSLVIGIWLALGLISLQRFGWMRAWIVKAFEILLLLPSFLPPLFLLLVLLSVVQPFPTGLIGVVLVHVVMNAGLVALLVKSLIETKMGPLVEAAAVEGASQFQFFKAGWGMVRRDLMALLLFVFIVCFCSFSVPLIAGGGRATTLEILIYEKIRISAAWSEALGLSLIQMIFILLISIFPFEARKKLFGRGNKLPLIGSRTGVIALFLYCISFILYFLIESVAGWTQVFEIPGLWESAVNLIPTSLVFGLAVGFFVAGLLFLTAYSAPNPLLHRLIAGMVSPSTALLGFSMLFFLPNEEPWNYVKWVLGFSYLILTTLYRWGWDQEVSGLAEQIQVAETLGASRVLILTNILLPQLLVPLARVASIASLWALGDFALGKILMGRDATLSLLIETLLSSYRLQSAMALMGLLLLLGCFCYFFFWGISYVARRALEQKI